MNGCCATRARHPTGKLTYPEPEEESPLKITVIGLGRLGAVAAGGLATAGHEVTGLDVDERRVKALTDGRIPFYEPGLEECLTVAVDRGNLRFQRTSDFSGCLGDVALIAAGTPASANGSADLSQVRNALGWVKSLRPRNLALVMKSTVPPGSGVEFLCNDLKGGSRSTTSPIPNFCGRAGRCTTGNSPTASSWGSNPARMVRQAHHGVLRRSGRCTQGSIPPSWSRILPARR